MRSIDKFHTLVEALQTLPSIGKKSALRLAYHMVLKDKFNAIKIANSIEEAVIHIRKCNLCQSISEHEICDICLDEGRDRDLLCIVESSKDIFLIEESREFFGLYFVLDGEVDIYKLKEIVKNNSTKEIIFALSPSVAHDTTIFFIEDYLKEFELSFTKIAQGVPTGVQLENIDSVSLSKAITSRTKI